MSVKVWKVIDNFNTLAVINGCYQWLLSMFKTTNVNKIMYIDTNNTNFLFNRKQKFIGRPAVSSLFSDQKSI